MAQVINTNIASLNAQRHLNSSQGSLQTSLTRLSSGLRINSAKDDAAGLAISERFSTQIRGMNQAMRNANDGISFAQTAEGALGEVGNAMQRIRELAVQSANDTNSVSDRKAINNEVSALINEINRIAGSTQFNGQNILDGTSRELVFQVGANQGQTIGVSGVDARGTQLGARVLDSNSFGREGVQAGTFSINNVDIAIKAKASADDIIQAINLESVESGVSAQKGTSVSWETAAVSNLVANATITINGAGIELATGATQADVIDAINAISKQTDVEAVAGATGIVLSNATGASIEVGDASSVIGGDNTYDAGIVLTTEVGKTITTTGAGALAFGLDDVTAGGTADILNDVNVLTRDNASNALRTVDFALQQISGLRAELGAVQTRFESTIANLSTTTENLSSARSRIMDTDFAAETANLTRGQILQQAGTAMLAQANSLPQNVLSLLR